MEDTIAAIATPYGEGGIGIIRISGPDTLSILNQLFTGKIENRRLSYGHIIDPESGQTADEVLLSYMKAPSTYTREDTGEINCHGGIVPLRKTLDLVLRSGARLAEPGEFTKRAFLNGRLDLSQAEAVIDVIKARTDKTFDVAMEQLNGAFSESIQAIRRDLLDLLVQTAVNIDYPDEDIEEMTYEAMKRDMGQISEKIEALLSTAGSGRILREGLKVAIIGKPNVGKSSLMNQLLQETRAIVTEIPGTTRDTIEELISIRGIPVRLTDTAGIRETKDKIEQLGIEKSKQSFNEADLILFVMDSSREISAEDREIMDYLAGRQALVLMNKTDLPPRFSKTDVEKMLPPESSHIRVLETSLLDGSRGSGLKQLEDAIEQLVHGGQVSQKESLLVTNARHKNLLEKAASSLTDAARMTDAGEALDFIEVDLKSAYDDLGEIIGETVSDEIIDEIFSRFCLGK